MNIEKKEIVTITDDNGKDITVGTGVIFTTNQGTMIGKFGGINTNGTLIFGPYIDGIGKTEFFRPGSIKQIVVYGVIRNS